jgi:hypothetical protein
MEILGLMLAFPLVFCANVAYAFIVHRFFSTRRSLWPWLLWPSRIALALMILDVVLVATVGAVSSRRIIGASFNLLHVFVIFFGAPSMANLLILTSNQGWHHKWYVVAGFCFILGMFLVFFQVGVGEALFGIDGVGGPYSR